MCPECSIQLNYRSQKREVKRRKSLKRLGKCSTSKDHSGPSSETEIEVEERDTPENPPTEESVSTEETQSTEEGTSESEIWKNLPTEKEEKTREEEFEEYLADLLL